jgi:hypothetical protein
MRTPPAFPAPVGRNPPLQGEINDGGSTAGVTGVGGSATNPGVAGNGGSVGVAGFSRVGVGVVGNAPLAQHFQARLNFEGIPIGSTLQGPFGFLGGRDPVFDQLAGVYGQSDQQGVMGLSTSATGTGVYGGGASHTGAPGAGCIGVRGETFTGVGVQGQSFGSGLAGKFIGDVEVTGDITAHDVVLAGGDCAEDFDISALEAVDPGTVMVIDETGSLRPCQSPYDKKVTGVISGAGDYKPGIILDKRASISNRLPLALLGKVYCKVDAEYGAIQIGDLLTTSSTPGHAMRAGDPVKGFGSVIGKALRPIERGQGLIPILVALQ